jgi:DNA polymerase III subunit beta
VRFRVDRDAFGEAVAWVARALSPRPVHPVLAGLLLTASDDQLIVSCFDYEVAAQAAIGAEVAEPGTALVPGRLLAEITRSLPAAPPDFGAEPEGIRLTCGPAEFTLVCLPAGDYPARPRPPEPVGVIDGGELAAAAAQVVPAASRDDTLPMLTAVCLEADGPALTLAATDRYRLAVRELGWEPVRPDLRAAALVPARILADASRAMSGGIPVSIGLDPPAARQPAAAGQGQPEAAPYPAEGMISFASGGKQLSARLIAGEYLRYRSRFPAGFGSQAEIPAAPLLEAVRRAALVADRASPVRLSFRAGAVVIEARAEGRAKAVETVPAAFDGDQPVISFDPQYLLDGLTAAAAPGVSRHPGGDPGPAAGPAEPGAGRIRLQFTSPAKPALITWAGRADGEAAAAGESGAGPDGAGFRYLLVPLRSPAQP